MKRGGFWMTTVATGVVVLGLMTVGRAGLKSQAVLFLQGQMKIATGDTDSGLKLLAEASNRPQNNAGLQDPLENSRAVKAAEPEKPCKGWTWTQQHTAPPRTASRTEQVSIRVKPAPEPTLARLTPSVFSAAPMLRTSYGQDAMAYVPAADREAIRAEQAQMRRAQRIREQEMRKVFREVSYHYQRAGVPSRQWIEMQVGKGLGTLSQ